MTRFFLLILMVVSLTACFEPSKPSEKVSQPQTSEDRYKELIATDKLETQLEGKAPKPMPDSSF